MIDDRNRIKSSGNDFGIGCLECSESSRCVKGVLRPFVSVSLM